MYIHHTLHTHTLSFIKHYNSGSGRISAFGQLAERNTIALKKILDQGDDGGVQAVRKVMDLYQSCLDTDQVNALGAEPMLELINRTGEL